MSHYSRSEGSLTSALLTQRRSLCCAEGPCTLAPLPTGCREHPHNRATNPNTQRQSPHDIF